MAINPTVLVDLITKANNVALGWYQSSEAMKSFPNKLKVLERQKNNWTSLLRKYGIVADEFVGSALQDALELLNLQEKELDQLRSNSCLLCSRKLVFPESVTNSMDEVIKAFEDLPKTILERHGAAKALQIASGMQVAPLRFKHDPRYVPLDTTVTAIREALEKDTTSQIVTLYGGTGTGKTSMAKHLALLYQDGNRGLHTEQPSLQKFQDAVLYLFCGHNANSGELLVEFWQKLGYDSLLPENSNDDARSPEQRLSRSESRLLTQLTIRLSSQEVLVVLDDVWEAGLIEKLLVQATGVKYLITTQQRDLWRDNTCPKIDIKKPNLEEAYKLLEKHISGFLATEIRGQLKDTIDIIIEKADYNPLVLATVATNIRSQKAHDIREWQSTSAEYHEDLLRDDEKAKLEVVLFGSRYSKSTMLTSMTLALSSFSTEEQTLLLLASICETKQAPEVVFKIFFQKIHNHSARFDRCCENLEDNDFIQIESNTVPGSGIPHRTWSLHTMRQDLIGLIKKDQVESMFAELLKQCPDDDIVITLLVLYGKVPWRNQAAGKMQISVDQFEIGSKRLQWTSMKSFVSLLQVGGKEEWQEQSFHAAKQVLQTYLHAGELDDYALDKLIGIPHTMIPTVEACGEFLSFAVDLQNFRPFPKSVDRLVGLLSPEATFDVQKAVTHILGCVSNTVENAKRIGWSSSATEGLVRLLHEEVHHEVQGRAAWTLGQISSKVVENAKKVGSFPGAIERLVGLLREGVTPDVQEHAALALGQISNQVVENATKVGSFPGAIERLVGLLREEVAPNVQARATWTLGQISKEIPEIAAQVGSFPGAIERLVGLLREGVTPKAQENAAWTLGQISKEIPEIAAQVGSFPGTIEKLVGLLREGVTPNVQVDAVWTLGELSRQVIENAKNVGSCPGAIERLVGFLREGVTPNVQECAVWTLGQISKQVVGNAKKVGSFPGTIERLVGLLREEVAPNVQANAAWTLGQISKEIPEIAAQVGSFPGAIERLVGLLREGVTPNVQEDAAWTLGQISKEIPEIAAQVGSFPNAMERLLALVAKDSGPELQCKAAEALANISVWVIGNQNLLGKAISNDPKALEGLLECAKSEKYKGGFLQYWTAQVSAWVVGAKGEHPVRYQSSQAYEGEGDAKAMRGDYRGALEAYENGLAIDSKQSFFFSKKSFVKTKLGDFQGALIDAEKCIEQDSDTQHGLQSRGVLKRMMGDLSGALTDLNEALCPDLDPVPDNYELLKHRGFVKFLLMDEDGARADAEQALKVKPSRVDKYSYGKRTCLGTSSVEYLGYKLK